MAGSRRGFTKIELIVVLIVLTLGLAVLIPFIHWQREAARRITCIKNLSIIGLAVHNFHGTYNCLPPSADIVGSGTSKKVGGWSFLVRLLPFMEENALYRTLTVNGGDPDAEPNNKNPHKAARDNSSVMFICPASPNNRYLKPTTKEDAVTNYKAMGATHIESLRYCIGQGTPKYPSGGPFNEHPDGAMFPGAKLKFANFGDGSAHTILVVETIDDTASCWARGTDATLVGLSSDIQYETPTVLNAFFYAPKGFNGRYDEDAAPEVQAIRTFLAFDFAPGHSDAGSYPAFGGNKPAYGPSSGHPRVVNHLFVDASVHCLSKQTDAAAYFFLITRNGGDPFPAGVP